MPVRGRAASSRKPASTSTKSAPGMAGTATSPCRCWRSPSWPRCGRSVALKKGLRSPTFQAGAAQRAGTAPPSCPHPPSPPPTRSRHDLRLVTLAPRPPSPRQSLPLEAICQGNTTVVLTSEARRGSGLKACHWTDPAATHRHDTSRLRTRRHVHRIARFLQRLQIHHAPWRSLYRNEDL
jgi:hypothetical protein